MFKIHSIQELQWCVLGYGGAVTQTVSGGGRKSVRNSSSYFTFPLLPLQMYRVHHFCWQWTLVLLSAMKSYSLGAASFWNAKRAHIRWKYTTIYTSLHCPDSLLHRSTLVLFIRVFIPSCLGLNFSDSGLWTRVVQQCGEGGWQDQRRRQFT